MWHLSEKVYVIFSSPRKRLIFLKEVCLQKNYEPPHDKTSKMAGAPSEDSDQPGHPPSLIRIFAARMKKAWVLSYQ